MSAKTEERKEGFIGVPERLLHDSLDVCEILPIREVGQAIRAHDCVELSLRSRLHFGAVDDGEDEDGDGVGGLRSQRAFTLSRRHSLLC